MPSNKKSKSCRRGKGISYFDSTADVIAQQLAQSSYECNHNEAYRLLLDIKNTKSSAKCKVHCQPDGIKFKRATTFGAQPFRKKYPYKEIKRFFTFYNEPTMLILGNEDKLRKGTFYDFYRFPEDHIPIICNLIIKAQKNSDYILTDEDGLKSNQLDPNLALLMNNDQSRLSKLSIPNNIEDKIVERKVSATEAMIEKTSHNKTENNSYLDRQKSFENEHSFFTTKQYDLDECGVYNELSKSEPAINSKFDLDEYVCSKSTLNLAEVEKLRHDPLFIKLSANLQAEEIWSIDLKYIDANQLDGNRIAPSGGIYMFVAHHKSHINHSDGSTEWVNYVPVSADDEILTAYY